MTHNELQEQIDAAPGPVVVVTGRSQCGKTTAALNIYRSLIGDGDTPDGCMLISPNAAASSNLRRRLLSESKTAALIGAQVNTFSHLAGGILAESGSVGRRVSPFQRHLILADIVSDLLTGGKLKALGAVADTPGLVLAIDRAISELKRAAVDPETLAPAVRSGPLKERDLLAIYQSYQNRLQTDELFDVEGQVWLARDRLAELDANSNEIPGLNGVKVIVVDGFTDFTPTQLEILDLVSRRGRRIVITLPYDEDQRERMWFWTHRTLNAIRAKFGANVSVVTAPPPPNRTPMEQLTDSLFDLDAEPRTPPANIKVISAPNIEAEASAAARRIKRLLLDGAQPGSIALLARSLEPYKQTIQNVFARHKIPIAQKPEALADAPLVRFLLDTLEAAPQLDHNAVLRIISNSYFRPESLGAFTATDASVAELIIRQGNVLEGRSSYAQAADRLSWIAAQNAPDDEDPQTAGRLQLGPMEVTPQHIASAAGLLEALFDAILNADGNPLKLAESLQIQQVVMSLGAASLVAGNLRAMAALDQVIGELSHLPRPAALRTALSQASCPAPRTESLVDVLDVLDARALRYKHVFLIGLGEGHFPARPSDNSLLGEAQRMKWSDHQVQLDSRRDLASREMLLFYLAASRADESLTLTYVTSDSSGRPAGAGSFLTSLLEPLGGIEALQEKGLHYDIPLGSYLPERNLIACRRDALVSAAAGWFDPERGRDDASMAWIAQQDPQKLTNLAGGLWASHKRWRPEPSGSFDGRIDSTELVTELQARYPEQIVFSASGLNTFGQCPWRYFAQYVLRLEPLAVPQRMLQPTSRGQFVHNVLFETMKRLSQAADGPVSPEQIDDQQMIDTLQAAVTELSEPLEAAAPYPSLWRIQRDRMHSQMKNYLLALKYIKPTGRCGNFELAFGLETSHGEPSDAMSSPEPVEIKTPAGMIRLRGKIDRVDQIDSNALLIVDYKTGALPSPLDIAQGRNLQLPLYSAAVAKILPGESSGGAFHRIGSGKSRKVLDFSPDTADRRISKLGGYHTVNEAAMQSVADFVTAMSEGQFDLQPTSACPSYCRFRQICQFSPARAEIKKAGGAS